MDLWDLIRIPLECLMDFIYNFVKNYGLAIILFTIVVKLILLPLNIKSQKAMRKQQKIQPVLAELQKKYANDKEKLQSEMMKLYKENDVSMFGGCLPMLIQFPILIGLYRVIQSYLNRPAGEVNFNFLGLDLSKVPSQAIGLITKGDFSDIGVVLLIIIPILAMLTTWISMKQSQKMAGQNNSQAGEQAAQMNGTMNAIMPVMTGFFAITLPSGMGLYWIVSNLVQMVQQYALNKLLDSKGDDFVVKVPEKKRKNSKKRR